MQQCERRADDKATLMMILMWLWQSQAQTHHEENKPVEYLIQTQVISRGTQAWYLKTIIDRTVKARTALYTYEDRGGSQDPPLPPRIRPCYYAMFTTILTTLFYLLNIWVPIFTKGSHTPGKMVEWSEVQTKNVVHRQHSTLLE